MQGWGIVFAAIAYLLFLFVVASYGDRRPARNRSFFARPAIYALSLAIYCTSWTFFGSVGLATTSGFDFLGIYVGPVLMITLGYPLYSHIIRVAKSERITSIADFIASRYGKSTSVGAVAATIAVLGIVPYIALQLKAISTSVDTMLTRFEPSLTAVQSSTIDTSFYVSLALALFTVLFGTRHADATEHQDGLMLAVATESVVKLIAFLAVGLFVTFYLFGGVGDMIAKSQQSEFVQQSFYAGIHPTKFAVYTLLSTCAFLLLPRQFHVGVVENHSQADLRTARWMFPLYLILINLFVIPVAVGGMLTFGSSVNADNYVLALPLQEDSMTITFLVFLGGLSAATAMVIVACVALAIMISNNIILPFVLRRQNARHIRDMAPVLLNIRRTSIFIILAMAYAYLLVSGNSGALASFGLLSFAAVAQFAPAFIGGMFWRNATARGALWGMMAGFGVWFYTLFLPTVLDPSSPLLVEGPAAIYALRPQALFGVEAAQLDHGVFFSLLANSVVYIIASLSRRPLAIERMQANTFWYWGQRDGNDVVRDGRAISVAELRGTISNYLGHERSDRSFKQFYLNKGSDYDPRELADSEMITFSEQLLASAIGAASSRLVLSLLLQKHEPAGETTIQLLDDASEALQYNRDLLQTALDQVEQGICVFDKEFRLSSWNKQFRVLLDLPPEMGRVGIALNQLSDAIWDRLDHTQVSPIDLTKQMLTSQEPFLLHLEGSKRIIEVHTNSVPDGGLVISWNDMTERTTAARALKEANETLERRVRERTEELTQLNDDLARAREAAETANIGKTKFLAAVGHDILQPLNAARLYASSLAEQLDDSPKSKLANNVDDALESVEDILGSVLAISRLDSGALNPNVSVFDTAKLLQKLQVEFQPIAENKGLNFRVDTNQFQIRSDFSLLRRLLQNLVSNAIKYTERGSVVLDSRVVRNQLVFEVRDTGSGIQPKDRDSIFEEFKRLEEGKRAAPGLGLGLSIVQRLADTLGHQVRFESHIDKGSTFFVTVPLVLDGVKPTERVAHPKQANDNLNGQLVYCIDNETIILDGMKTLLSGWGCNVVCFEHSTALLETVAKDVPAVLIADYHLNNEDGLDVISKARLKSQHEFLAVLVTADRSAAVRNAAKAIDVTVMNKPLKPAALRALLTRISKVSRANNTDSDTVAAE
jgi:Na+/proline symporter/signal transduction histidine kinase/ActR/RegA family two-component response regulator